MENAGENVSISEIARTGRQELLPQSFSPPESTLPVAGNENLRYKAVLCLSQPEDWTSLTLCFGYG